MLLVALGAALSGLLVLRSGDRVDVIVTTGPIVAGQEITREQLGTVSVAVPNSLSVFRRSDADQLLGRFAAVDITPGTLVTAEMVTDQPVPGPGQAVVSVSLPQSRLPTAALQPGDHVRVLLAPPRGEQAPQELRNLANGIALADGGRVLTVEADEITGNTSLSLLMSGSEADAVALAAAKESVSLVEIPVEGEG